MLDVIPLPSGCPMTTTRKRRRYLATVARGEAIVLQGEKSGVKLEIKEGCPQRPYLMEVRTDLCSFGSMIPDDECFISPVVTILAPAETNTSSYVLRIPHCLDEDDDKTKVRVRLIHENSKQSVVVPEGKAGTLYYEIGPKFIELHTPHFTKVICSICQKPYECFYRITSLWLGKFDTMQEGVSFSHDVEIRPYFCGIINTIEDFQEVFRYFLPSKNVSFTFLSNFCLK